MWSDLDYFSPLGTVCNIKNCCADGSDRKTCLVIINFAQRMCFVCWTALNLSSRWKNNFGHLISYKCLELHICTKKELSTFTIDLKDMQHVLQTSVAQNCIFSLCSNLAAVPQGRRLNKHLLLLLPVTSFIRKGKQGHHASPHTMK